MKRLEMLVVLSSCLLTSFAFAAPKYIEAPPLSEVVKTPVGSVKSGKVQLPLITWGADIRTIYANGNARKTKKGSLFSDNGLNIQLKRVDVFTKQIEDYLSGKSPYLRGTLGMINMAAEKLSKDSRTKPVIIYQLSESAGGDALVVKSGIRSAKDLKGKTIALQAYGPHVDYLSTILKDAGLSLSSVKLRWLSDLTGSDNTPMAAFYESGIDAALVIIPDALALTSGGAVGTGSEDSVRGAKILLSTKTANKVIADVYAVRSDYFKKNKKQVEKLASALIKAQEEVSQLVKNKVSRASDYRAMMKASAEILLDSAQAVSDAEALYADAEHTNLAGNKKFFQNRHYPRNFQRRTKEIQKSFKAIGLINKSVSLKDANWDYSRIGQGVSTASAEVERFDKKKVASVVAKRKQQGRLDEGALFSFEVFFKPNQKTFPADLYQDEFNKVINLASTYGGAIITIEGHSDPLGYLKKKKNREKEIVLRQVKQSAKNLSLTRASAVRDSIVNFAKSKQILLDKSQFAVVGHGISNPKSGNCGADPCPPKTEQEWRDNMRVEFRIIQIEAEAQVFQPL